MKCYSVSVSRLSLPNLPRLGAALHLRMPSRSPHVRRDSQQTSGQRALEAACSEISPTSNLKPQTLYGKSEAPGHERTSHGASGGCFLNWCMLSRSPCSRRDSKQDSKQHAFEADWPGRALVRNGTAFTPITANHRP